MTITEFLLARIDEDEAVARRVPDIPDTYRVVSSDPDAADPGLAAQHYIRNNPARVLADCKAQRRIVEMHPVYDDSDQHDCPGEWPNHAGPGDPCPTLLVLASVYADHPDYREEWRA